MEAGNEKMKVSISTILSSQDEFEELIGRWVDGILASVLQQTHRLHEELDSEIQQMRTLVEVIYWELKA
jgi:hypothetical protein